MRAQGKSNTILLAGIFAALVLFLVGASLVIKLLGILAQSSFDGQHRFTVLLSDASGNSVYVSVDPMEKSSTRLFVKDLKARNEVKAAFPVAIDGEVVLSAKIDPTYPASGLITEMLVKKNNLRSGVTGVDLIRMYWTAKIVEPENRFEEEASLAQASQSYEFFARMFSDQAIEDEDMTIAIENGTTRSGVGGRLESILSVLGANVISVETSSVGTQSSYMTFFESPSYTSGKVQRLLGYPAIRSDAITVSDISIIIGEDGFDNFVFRK